MKKVVTAIAVAALCALVFYCVRYIQAPVSTISAYGVTHEELITGDAFIVRKETVYTASANGTLYSFAREGARVGRNRRISAVYSGTVDEAILQELGTISAKITELGSVVVDNSGFTSDSGSAAARLLQLEKEIETAAADNDVAKISECKAEIESLAAGGTVKSNAEQLALLNAQREELEAKITGPRQDIISTVSGIYSSKIDGYEETLNVDTVKNITVSEFAKIKPEQTAGNAEKKDSKQNEEEESGPIAAGDKICKIIDNHEWYVAALVKRDDIADMSVGKKVELRFGKLPGEQVPAEVVSVSNDPPGQEKAVVVLKCESYSEGAFSIRASDVEIIKKSYSGFEVPVHAIRVSDEGQNGVIVRVGGKESFKPCRIIYQDEEKGNAIIVADTDDPNKELRQYDLIVVGEK